MAFFLQDLKNISKIQISIQKRETPPVTHNDNWTPFSRDLAISKKKKNNWFYLNYNCSSRMTYLPMAPLIKLIKLSQCWQCPSPMVNLPWNFRNIPLAHFQEYLQQRYHKKCKLPKRYWKIDKMVSKSWLRKFQSLIKRITFFLVDYKIPFEYISNLLSMQTKT